jgi:CheY-like chemotaxis protein
MNESEAQHAAPTSSSFVNVLVVDDNKANLLAFESLIEPLGYAVFLAESGQQALDLAGKFRFAVVLLDVRMPKLSGIETAVLLRRKPFTHSTPIVFVSAYEEMALDVSRSPVDGLVDFVYSPVNPEILIWKVRTWVDLHIKNDLLRHRAARVSEAQEALHQLVQNTPVPETLRQADSQLSRAVSGLMESLSDREGISV